jgi:heme-degrading monooxygenase HmoA
VEPSIGHLDKVPRFVEFHLLRGPEADDHTLYASHTVWQNRATFEAWTKSEAFRAAHAGAGGNKAHLSQIERIDKHVDHANRVALVNKIIEAFGQ